MTYKNSIATADGMRPLTPGDALFKSFADHVTKLRGGYFRPTAYDQDLMDNGTCPVCKSNKVIDDGEVFVCNSCGMTASI